MRLGTAPLLLTALLLPAPIFANSSECSATEPRPVYAPEKTRFECRGPEREDGLRIEVYRDFVTQRLLRKVRVTEEDRDCNSGANAELPWSSEPETYWNGEAVQFPEVAPGLMYADEFLVGFADSLTPTDLAVIDELLEGLSSGSGDESALYPSGIKMIWRSSVSRDGRIVALRIGGGDLTAMMNGLEAVPPIVLEKWANSESSVAELTPRFIEPHFILQEAAASPRSGHSRTRLASNPDKLPWGLVAAKLPRAWDCMDTKGDRNVNVSLLDSGVYSCHVEVTDGLPSCPDAAFRKNEFLGISDLRGHGTQCAGVIAAQEGLLTTTGVAPRVGIVPMRILNRAGRGEILDAVNAIQFLTRQERTDPLLIVNASWGLSSDSESLKTAVGELIDSGALLIAAAGNYGDDIRRCPFYPASYVTEPGMGDAILAVAGVDLTVRRGQAMLVRWGDDCSSNDDPLSCSGSNYGGEAISFGAPGEDILTLGTQNRKSLTTAAGTSMAAAFVAGAAALLKSHFPEAEAAEIVKRLKNGACRAKFLEDFWDGGRFIDIEGALAPQAIFQRSNRDCQVPFCSGELCSNAPDECRLDDVANWFVPE